MGRNGIHRLADNNPPTGDDHQFVFFVHHPQGRQSVFFAVGFEFSGDRPFPGPSLQSELVDGNPLAVASGGNRQHPGPHPFIGGIRFLIPIFRGNGQLFFFNLVLVILRQTGNYRTRQNIHADRFVPFAQIHRLHPPRGPTEGTQLFVAGFEMNGHAVTRPDDNAILGFCPTHPPQLVAVIERDGNQAIGANVGKSGEGSFFDVSPPSEHD